MSLTASDVVDGFQFAMPSKVEWNGKDWLPATFSVKRVSVENLVHFFDLASREVSLVQTMSEFLNDFETGRKREF